MNNGRPPYGDPSQWSRQPAGQDAQAQFVPGQNPQQGSGAYQQPYAQPGYGQQYAQSQPWQPQTYQPQARQAQEDYQQQSWQPYGQPPQQNMYAQPGYQQPQQSAYAQPGYQQPQQSAYAQPGYQQPQQNAYAQPGYQQPQQNAYAQPGYQQPQQNAYAQPGYQQPQQNMYAQGGYQQQYQQGVQNGQPLQQPVQQAAQFHPATGYSGYVTQPEGADGGTNPFSAEVLAKVALFGLLPVLFALGVLLKVPVLCWLFILAAAGTVAVMWLRPVVEEKLRLVSTMIIGVLAVVALITALAGPGTQQEATGDAGQAGNAGQTGAQATGMLSWEYTPTPTPAATPDPYAEAGEAAEVLQSFFYFWHVNNDENMLAMTAPSWRNQQEEPLKALFTIRANRTPEDDLQIIEISGTEMDTTRTARVRVTINKHITGRQPDVLAFDIVMLKEDGQWYVDPRSLASNEVVSTTKATNEMPTQPVLNTAQADTVLYYNPDGGSKYHIDPECGSTNKRYLPMRGQFLFSQINDAPYSELENCTYCGAPLRNK